MAPRSTRPPTLNPPAAPRGLGPSRLSAEIWLHRHGWALPLSALVLLATGLLWGWQVAPGNNSVAALRAQLQAAQAAPRPLQTRPPEPQPEPGQSLRALLGRTEADPAQVRRIAKIARAHGITLPRGQYSSSRQMPSGIARTEVTFSFSAGYPQSRAFIEGVLRELPNASVDRVSFEREQVDGADTRITLHLTLWRWPATPKNEVAP